MTPFIAGATIFALILHVFACLGARDVAKSDLAGRGLAVLFSSAFFLAAHTFALLATILELVHRASLTLSLILLAILSTITLLTGFVGVFSTAQGPRRTLASLPAYTATPALALAILLYHSSRPAHIGSNNDLLVWLLILLCCIAIHLAARAVRQQDLANRAHREAWQREQAEQHAQRWRTPSPDLIDAGSVFFEDPPTLLRPRCTRWAFSTMALAQRTTHHREEPFDIFTFQGPVEGRTLRAQVRFKAERLVEIHFDQIESLESPGQFATIDQAAQWLSARLSATFTPSPDHPAALERTMKWGVVRVESDPHSPAARVRLLFQSLE